MRTTTTTARTLRAVALAAIFAMLLVACGQKPGVHVSSGARGGGATGGTDGGALSGDDTLDDATIGGTGGGTDDGVAFSGDDPVDDTLDDTVDDTLDDTLDDGPTDGGDDGDTTTDGGDDGDTTTDGGDDGGDTGGDDGGVPGDDRTGAGPDKLVYGVHAPVTGAAPIESASFEEGRDLYWKWWIEDQGKTVLGRSEVEVLFRDDQYNPSTATQVCREMARSGNAFTLVGGGGTDQIQACGQWSNQNQVPYFSAGVTEKGLRSLPWYFATSMSYKQQGDLLGQMVDSNFNGQKTAMIVTDTPNFDDAVEGWTDAVDKYNIDNYEVYRHPKGDETWYRQKVIDYQTAGVQVIYPMTSPVGYGKFVTQAANQGYFPQYIGAGVTHGLNAVASVTCPGAAGALFFSPFPGMDWAEKNVPEYFETAEKHGWDDRDDLGFALWGLAKSLHEMWIRYGEVYGNDLTREAFREVMEQSTIKTGIFPTVRYSPQDHFGASTVHLLENDCSGGSGEMITRDTFVDSF